MTKSTRTRNAEFLSTLVYVDEPQLVLLSLEKKARVIAVAVHDQSDSIFPFIGAQINDDQFQRYIRGFVDLHFLFSFPRYKRWFKFDLSDSKNNKVKLTQIEKESIPEKSLPSPGFFSRDHTEEYDIEEQKLAKQNFQIDGSWDLRDFSHFYGKYSDIYSFILSLKKYHSANVANKLKRKIVEAFINYPWRGGGSYVNFYGDLSGVQDFNDRLSVGSIQYASPGHVEINGNKDVFELVGAAIENYRNNHEIIYAKYRDLHGYLRKMKLLRASADHFDNSGGVANYLRSESKFLASLLLINDFQEIYKLADKNSLATAKIVLSYCRRLDNAFMFFAEGRVSFGRLTS